MSVDLRTRADSEQALLEASGFFRETLPERLTAAWADTPTSTATSYGGDGPS